MKRFLAAASALTLIVSLCLGLTPLRVFAAANAQDTLLYTLVMRDSQGAAITDPLTLRFSLWNSTDFVESDRDGTAINVSAPNYSGWTEVQNITPADGGLALFYLGAITPLPDLDFNIHKYLQVEVKGANQADNFYQLIDIAGTNGTDAVDRRPLSSMAYAQNARMLDGHTVGTAAGDLLALGLGGVVDVSQMGMGTNADSFTIDADGSGNATLTFGSHVSPVALTFSEAHQRFEFSNDVYIDGDLTVTGKINGMPVQALAAGAALYVSADSGLNVAVTAGTYRLNGTVVQYSGTSGVAVPDNAISAMYFDADGLQISQTGFPQGAYIPLAQVRTVNGAIVSVLDLRALQSDDREVQEQLTLHPPFEGASNKGDGTNNVGMLYVDLDAAIKQNFYLWTSTQASLQDFEVNVPVTLPPTFLRWRNDPVVLHYRSTSASTDDNSLSLTATDTAGQAVTLVGASDGLVSTSWAETALQFGGSPTWTPGETMMLKFKVSARNNKEMHLGDIEIHFDALQ